MLVPRRKPEKEFTPEVIEEVKPVIPEVKPKDDLNEKVLAMIAENNKTQSEIKDLLKHLTLKESRPVVPPKPETDEEGK